jgi:hypothetical protein
MPPSSIESKMRTDVEEILGGMPPEDRERLRAMSQDDLILLHHALGMELRNAFRANRFPGLSAYCHAAVEESGEPLSFDALSSVAIRKIWRILQKSA